jgi:5-methylcytosine-specific restriction endonuclease McrA
MSSLGGSHDSPTPLAAAGRTEHDQGALMNGTGRRCRLHNAEYTRARYNRGMDNQPPTHAMKRCSRCQEEKPLTAFKKHRCEKDGLNYECKDCDRARRVARTPEQLAVQKAQARAVRERNRTQNAAINEPDAPKICVRCQKTKPRTAFAISKGLRDGRAGACRECLRLRFINPEARALRTASNKAWRKANSEQYLAQQRELYHARDYKERYRTKHRASWKRWAAQNPDRIRIYTENTRAKRKSVMRDGHVSTNQWRQILEFYNHQCGQCGAGGQLHMDHYRPLAKGGGHDWRNVWPLCASCNLRKAVMVPTKLYPPHVELTMRRPA